jgi:hypothetical protein
MLQTLTAPLNLNLGEVEISLNSSSFLTGRALVKPSAT